MELGLHLETEALKPHCALLASPLHWPFQPRYVLGSPQQALRTEGAAGGRRQEGLLPWDLWFPLGTSLLREASGPGPRPQRC